MSHPGRWDLLAADLSIQAEALDAQLRAEEVAERLRHEVGQLLVVDRLRGAVGTQVVLSCAGQVAVRGTLTRVASDALLVLEPGARECLVAMAHVLSISGISGASAPAGTAIADRVGLRVLLRAIARDRSGVRLALANGSVLDGTFDRIGSDFVELAVHAAAEARRRGSVRDVAVVPLAALVAVRRDR